MSEYIVSSPSMMGDAVRVVQGMDERLGGMYLTAPQPQHTAQYGGIRGS